MGRGVSHGDALVKSRCQDAAVVIHHYDTHGYLPAGGSLLCLFNGGIHELIVPVPGVHDFSPPGAPHRINVVEQTYY
jgi:hypothetical protein